jgi:hypothetical protein
MRILYIILLATLATSCEKVICREPEKNSQVNAMVMWAGHPAADGLGWVLRVENGKTEKPSNLPDAFKTDSLNVSVEFEKTNEKFPCFCVTGSIDMVRIISIRKR